MTERQKTLPFQAILFDCDSTLSRIEGIDELGGGRKEIQDLTRRAMEGKVTLEEVYAERLRIIAPSRAEVERVGRLYVDRITEDAREVVQALTALSKAVHIVSGGLRPALRFLADHLGVPAGRVHAVDMEFGAEGAYRGFDQASPLARSLGKRTVAAEIKRTAGRTLLVGDGITDLEATSEVDLFVGFGGVATRESVRRQCEVYVESPTLAPVLLVALTGDELESLESDPRFRPLVSKARGLAHMIHRHES